MDKIMNTPKRKPGRPSMRKVTPPKGSIDTTKKYSTAEAICLLQSGEVESFVNHKGYTIKINEITSYVSVYDHNNIFIGKTFSFAQHKEAIWEMK
jgi:hypothetical protein|nr:MAG: hypothetical protein [Bacteriophage sp.]